MKKLLLVIVLTAMGMFEGHSQALVQTYVDRCTGQVSVFSVPMNGSTVVAFYNKSRVFTSKDFQNGTLQAWLEETYLWWTSLSPCSTVTTGAQATQQTTQQTTQQATQAATNAAQQAATTTAAPTTSIPAPTTPTTNAPSTPTSPPPTTETPQTTSPDTGTANTSSGSPDTSTSRTDASSTGNDTSSTGGPEASSTETQSSSEQTDTSSTETTESTNETTETTSSEDTSTEDSSTETSSEDTSSEETSTEESTETETEEVEETSTEESTEESSESETEESTEESTEEESTDESTEEESTEEESETEETDEESNEEESDESSEEDSEEEETEEESSDDEDEESEEEDTEEESNDEDEEEDDKKKKKKRNLTPPIVTANAMSQQLPTGEFQQAFTVGISQSSLMGDKTYGINAMVFDNLQQFMLTANYSKVHINKEGRVSRVYSASLGGMKMFTTYMAMMNHSITFLGKKGSVAGIALGNTVTWVEIDAIQGNFYLDTALLGTSLTGFYTKTFQYSPKLSISPMLAISSPFMQFDLFKHNTIWNKNLMLIGGSNFTYRLTQRFGLNLGVNFIESTLPNFPTMKTFTIGGRLSF
tara:strand:- start:489 stop:2261 length:1773 start_codon:yes stop_codon:yes gene_type:complete